jgi:hypothetical protein
MMFIEQSPLNINGTKESHDKFPNTISSEKNLYRYVFLSYPFPPVHLSLYTDIHFHTRHLHMYTFVCVCVCVLEYRNAGKADNESDVFKWEDGGGQAVLLEYRNAENDPVHEKIFQKKWGKGALREVIYAIAATERTKLFEKTSNSTSVHTGKELP